MKHDFDRILNRLAKWRAHFAGWQLGTRGKDDPECQAVRDHREVTLLLRAEVNAISRALIENKVCSQDRFTELVCEEAILLEKQLEQRWPGVRATDEGLAYDNRVMDWMKKWRP